LGKGWGWVKAAVSYNNHAPNLNPSEAFRTGGRVVVVAPPPHVDLVRVS
jgi:hypothetical protein